MSKFDVIIIGAGAAGIFCGIEAARRGRSVLILEHTDQPGKKILISGGGKCNFTNLHARAENYLSANPKFCISALSRYTPQDFIHRLESHSIQYTHKKRGQLFCKESAIVLLRMLLEEAHESGVQIINRCTVQTLQKENCFTLLTSQGDFKSDNVVIATGGLSIPEVGASDFGYRMAEQFGHTIMTPHPGLTPLVFNQTDKRNFQDIPGLSVDAEVSIGKTVFRESLLFTHIGLSGPAILQISSYWTPHQEIMINLYPDSNLEEYFLRLKRHSPQKMLSSVLGDIYPQRFAQRWCDIYIPSKPMQQYTDVQLRECAHHINHWKVIPVGTEGYRVAEVTCGGVNTKEINPGTMESKLTPGLYFVGEILDVTGWLGGYNFQWAWSSGWAAGQSV
jgi:predicted Rossmann fold flavoprotein